MTSLEYPITQVTIFDKKSKETTQATISTKSRISFKSKKYPFQGLKKKCLFFPLKKSLEDVDNPHTKFKAFSEVSISDFYNN